MERITHNVAQGSDAWRDLRIKYRGASEAGAMLGVPGAKGNRTDLLHMKYTGSAKEFSEWVRNNVLRPGHAVEEKARPLIEVLIGEDLYPVTMTWGGLLASCDGLTMTGSPEDEIAFEHKTRNAVNEVAMAAGEVPDEYMPQCQQVLLVTGAKKLIFAVSNGTQESLLIAEVLPDPQWFERLQAGWAQFDADLAAYVPHEIKERPHAEVTLSLPALVIHAKGEITTSNMQEYGAALTQRLAEVRAIQLVTDQDFSNAKESAKLLRENIQQAQHAKDAMLAQTVTVGEAARMIDTWCEDMRLTALKLEKDVEREDRIKKADMIAKAKALYEQHVDALVAETGGPWIAIPMPDWASALKNKRSYASMQDALDTMLANAKIVADESARKIRASLACMAEEGKGYEFLLADRLAHISKPVDDVRMLVRARITEHKAAQQEKDDDRIAEIAAEAKRKAEAEAAENARMALQEIQGIQQQVIIATAGRLGVRTGGTIQCIRDTLAETQAWPIGDHLGGMKDAAQAAKDVAVASITALLVEAEARAAAPAPSPAPAAAPAPVAPALPHVTHSDVVRLMPPAVVRAMAPQPAPGMPPSLTLGAINKRLQNCSVTADQLRAMGITPAARQGASQLFHEQDFHRIREALIRHLEALAELQAA